MRRLFLWCFVALGAAILMSGTAIAADVTWDGATAAWNSANWNGSQTASAVLGSTGGVPSGYDVYINSGTVTYDPVSYGDWDVRIGSTVTVSGSGTMLQMDSDASAPDGYWTQFDGDVFNVSDGATYRRGTTGGAGTSGGPIMLASWRAATGQKITMNVNGGNFINDGQVWFGAPSDNDPEIDVSLNISGGGTVDLTGGNSYTTGGGMTNDDALFILEDMAFCYGNTGTGPKNEKYALNFKGPGTLTVDNGIIAPVQDASGYWYVNVLGSSPNTKLSYLELYDAGILQARGVSGDSGIFSKYFTVTGTPTAANYTITSTVPDATSAPIVWDGGDGAWNSANWNSGQTAQQVLGRTNGVEFGTSGEQGIDVFINSGTVTYDPNTRGDFRYKRAGTLNLSGGATLQMDSSSQTAGDNVDGRWTQWNGEEINITGGATLRRGFDSGSYSQSGGAFILGTWSTFEGQKMAVNISNGGRLENDGQLWFGCPSDSAAGIEAIMTIDGGHVDLTGGDNHVQDNDGKLLTLQDLVFVYNYDANETYAINFTGGGTFTVDDGIIAPIQDAAGNWTSSLIGGSDPYALLSYEDLWNNGLLQASGLSGLDGETFGDYFTVTGQKDQDNYTLTSTNYSVIPGDATLDGVVDVSDLGVLATNYGMSSGAEWTDADFDGNGVVDVSDLGILATWYGYGTAAAAAVPEPSMLMLLVIGGLTLISRRRK